MFRRSKPHGLDAESSWGTALASGVRQILIRGINLNRQVLHQRLKDIQASDRQNEKHHLRCLGYKNYLTFLQKVRASKCDIKLGVLASDLLFLVAVGHVPLLDPGLIEVFGGRSRYKRGHCSTDSVRRIYIY